MTDITSDKEKEEITTTIDNKSEKFVWTKDKIILAIIFVLLVVVSVVLLVMMIIDKTLLFTIVRDWFIRPILSLHIAWRVVIFIALMMLQSLLVPIPSELILVSGAIIFGFGWGTVIGIVGSMLSAAITYYLSKRGGRAIIDATGKKVGIINRTIIIFDEWIKKWGLWAILVGRAVPVIMFDPISYAAGLANIKDWQYFLATFIGSIPRAIFYGFLGIKLLGDKTAEEIIEGLTPAELENISGNFNLIFFIIFGVLILMFVLANIIYYVRERKKNQLQKNVGETEENKTEELDNKQENQELGGLDGLGN